MTTSMASKIAISTTLAMLMTCTTEIVTAEKRRLCGYTITVWTRIWLLSAPFVGATSLIGRLGKLTFLCKIFETQILFPTVPQTVMSLLNILGSLVTALIDTPRSVDTLKTNHELYTKGTSVPEVWKPV